MINHKSGYLVDTKVSRALFACFVRKSKQHQHGCICMYGGVSVAKSLGADEWCNRADTEQCCAKAKIKSSMFDRCKRFLLLFTAAEPEDLTMS